MEALHWVGLHGNKNFKENFNNHFDFRLTESGLSMVNWDLFRTMKPPLNEADWEREFENYKAYPEYKLQVFSIQN